MALHHQRDWLNLSIPLSLQTLFAILLKCLIELSYIIVVIPSSSRGRSIPLFRSGKSWYGLSIGSVVTKVTSLGFYRLLHWFQKGNGGQG